MHQIMYEATILLKTTQISSTHLYVGWEKKKVELVVVKNLR